MISGGGSKFSKTKKTKFRKNLENSEEMKNKKQKHHDKSFYRLVKEEKLQYD